MASPVASQSLHRSVFHGKSKHYNIFFLINSNSFLVYKQKAIARQNVPSGTGGL